LQFYSKKLLSIAKKQFFDAIKLNRSLLSCMSESHKSQTIRISQKQLFPKLGTTKNSKNKASQSWEQHFRLREALFYDFITNLIHNTMVLKKIYRHQLPHFLA